MTRGADIKTPPLEIDKVKTVEQAMSNCLFLAPSVYRQFVAANNGIEPVYGQLNEFVFILKEDRDIAPEKLGVPAAIRTSLKLSTTLDKPVVSRYELPKQLFMLSTVKMQVTAPRLHPDEKVEIEEQKLIDAFRKQFSKHFIGTQQEFYLNLDVNYLDVES
jgi:hypothetical protein